MAKNNGDMISFLMQKQYIMVNNNLGSGSFGKTVLLKDPFIDELFVAKKYEPEFDDQQLKEKFYKNFLDEIKILYKLNHKNIVRIYNYYAYESIYTGFILMEYIDGQNIKDYINNYISIFEDNSIDDIFLQMIEAFCYIEEHGIIHRDIREANILVDKSGNVKIIDFGIGKIFNSQEQHLEDSLVSRINREGSDTLPQEYYAGIYTSQTDMFYLAELLKRLLTNTTNSKVKDFSYEDILDKMMEKNPKNRFDNFKAVRDAVNKKDFFSMEISEEDKKIYLDFTDSVYNLISVFTESPRFIMQPEIFISKIKNIINNNLFETYIQNNEDVINCIIETSKYRYYPLRQVSSDVIKKFLQWFCQSTPQSQELILKNFISKLSTIKIKRTDTEVPF